MGYSLCMMADSQTVLIYLLFSFFGAVVCTEQLKMISRMDFDMFFAI